VYELRDYQARVVDDLRAAFGRSRAVCLVMKTGLGKTVVAGYINSRLAENRLGALVLVHREELLHQFCRTLDEAGLAGKYGVIAAGRAESPWQRFQVAMIQTLARRKCDWLDPFYLVWDECHHIKAPTYEEVAERFPASRILGMTATPRRFDGKPLDRFDEMVHGPTFAWSVEHGHLAPVKVIYDRKYRHLKLSGVKVSNGEYSRKQLAERVDRKVIADALHAWQEHAAPRGQPQTVFFGVNTEHSKQVAKSFRDAGIPAEHVDGKTDRNVRSSVMDSFRKGTTRVLCNVDIISEGFDLPECEVLLDGQPTLSVARYMQKCGRVMRPKPDGRAALHIDLVRSWWVHGYPDQEREWSLEGEGPGGPSKTAEASNYRACRDCCTLYPRHRDCCPSCGSYPPPLDVPDSEVRELDADEIEEMDELSYHQKAELRKELRRLLKAGLRGRGLSEAIGTVRDRYANSPAMSDSVSRVLSLSQ